MYVHSFWGCSGSSGCVGWMEGALFNVLILSISACFFIVTSFVLLVGSCGCELVSLGGVDVTSQHLDKCLEDSLAGILQNPDSSNCSFSSSISCFTTAILNWAAHSLWPRNAWPWWLQLSPQGASIRHTQWPPIAGRCDGNVGTAGFGSFPSGVESYTKRGLFIGLWWGRQMNVFDMFFLFGLFCILRTRS